MQSASFSLGQQSLHFGSSYKRVEDHYHELWGHTKRRYNDNWQYTDWRSNALEFRTTECEIGSRDFESDAGDLDLLDLDLLKKDYVRRSHSGLILNGGFLEREKHQVDRLFLAVTS